MIRRLLEGGVEWLCLVLMVVLSIDLMLGVFSRYVLFNTFTWYDEVARVCFVWLVFLGAAVGIKRAAHFHLNLLVDNLPGRAKRATALLGPLAIIVFSLALIVQGWDFLELGRFQSLPVMGISKAWVYAAMPVGGVLMILYSIEPLWRAVRELGR
jgi:TRAP-type C4-dicarboxylate transport system permease small subunit